MSRTSHSCAMLAASLGLCVPAAAHAGELLGSFGLNPPRATRIGIPSGSTSVLGDLTLNGVPIGGTISDLASAPAGGAILALGSQAGQFNLFAVDPLNGSLEFSGPITLNGAPLAGTAAGALARDGSGTVRLVASVGGVANLFTLSTAGAAASLLGSLTLANQPLAVSSFSGLASSPAGETFGLMTVGGQLGLYVIADDGAVSFRGTPTLNGFQLTGTLGDLAFSSDGTLYTVLSVGQSHSLLTLNPLDASLTLLAPVGLSNAETFTGLATIPAPGSAALLAMFGVLARRRR